MGIDPWKCCCVTEVLESDASSWFYFTQFSEIVSTKLKQYDLFLKLLIQFHVIFQEKSNWLWGKNQSPKRSLRTFVFTRENSPSPDSTQYTKSKILFSKIVKGETNILCVKNRQFKLSKYVSNLVFFKDPPLTFSQNVILFSAI